MAFVKKGTFDVVRQVSVDEKTLEKIAELLGIPEAERGQLISGTIYIGSTPPSAGSAAEEASRSATQPSKRRASKRSKK